MGNQLEKPSAPLLEDSDDVPQGATSSDTSSFSSSNSDHISMADKAMSQASRYCLPRFFFSKPVDVIMSVEPSEHEEDTAYRSSSSVRLRRPSLHDTCGGGSGSWVRGTSDPSLSCSATGLSEKLQENMLEYTDEELQLSEEPTFDSDMQRFRHYWIVTTAALPWMTGTAINPLLRAAHLAKRNETLQAQPLPSVTLVIPWLESSLDRQELYGDDWTNATQDTQEAYLRNWLDQLGLNSPCLQFQFYKSRYHKKMSSIFALGDLCELELPDCPRQDRICILEEPEHVNFYRAPSSVNFRDLFAHVIGIVHTNYVAYAQNHYSGMVTAPLVGAVSSLLVRAYCDKVLKLSPVLQTYAPEREVVSNVHGIRPDFLNQKQPLVRGIYFLGKLLWAKGLDKLMSLQEEYRASTGDYFEIVVYGSGPEEDEIRKAYSGGDTSFARPASDSNLVGLNLDAPSNMSSTSWMSPFSRRSTRRQPLPATFPGRCDHASVRESILVNPSVTEVLCTVTAEAIAMGKFVILPRHASNEFFLQFPNCLQYQNPMEFVAFLQFAASHDPTPLTDEQRYQLTWEAATERFLQAGAISKRDAKRRDRMKTSPSDQRIAKLHYQLGSGKTGDVLRKVLGGGPVAEQSQFRRTASTCN